MQNLRSMFLKELFLINRLILEKEIAKLVESGKETAVSAKEVAEFVDRLNSLAQGCPTIARLPELAEQRDAIEWLSGRIAVTMVGRSEFLTI